MTKVTIITPCFNSADTIQNTLESVDEQSYKTIEHIVVDGGSKDETLSIIRSKPNAARRILSESDNGMYDAINKGINIATGQIIAILNSDDRFQSKTSVQHMVDVFTKHPDTSIVIGHIVFENKNSEITRFYPSTKFSAWKMRFGWMPPHPATFIRADCYRKYGGYKTNYEIAADYELLTRLLVRHKIKFRKTDVVYVRMSLGGKSTKNIRSSLVLNREIIRSCAENKIYTNWLLLTPKIPFKFFELFKRPSSNQLDY